jgi:rod shape-determining protein MreC
MRKLFKFLKKFRDFLIFFVLQIFVLSLFFNSKKYHTARLFNTSSSLIAWVVEKKHNITRHFSLPEANEKLASENARLWGMMPESFYQLQSDMWYVDDKLNKQQYQYFSAEVINSTVSKGNNYFTLNKGASSGIEPDMGVMGDDGIIGFVVDVSEHFALVKTVLSDNINIPVKLRKNNEHWLLKWDGYDSEIAQVNGVNRDIDIAKGDTIVTRGGKGMFPVGLPVGVVEELISKDGKQTWDVNIRLSYNFSAPYHVYVIKNLLQVEQTQLENKLMQDE